MSTWKYIATHTKEISTKVVFVFLQYLRLFLFGSLTNIFSVKLCAAAAELQTILNPQLL